MSKPRTTRSASYSIEEDQVLCRVYCDVTQDQRKSNNYATEQLWTRISNDYHALLPSHIVNHRPLRSLQTRMQNIVTAAGKLRGCIRQIENLNPSGASEQDILERAKELLTQETKYHKGFKFDHVWPIVKHLEKFKAPVSGSQSVGSRKRNSDIEESDSQADRVDKSIGSSSFCVDLNDDFESQGLSNEKDNVGERPTGRKKEKKKKQQDEECHQFIANMTAQNEKMQGIFKQNQDIFQKNYELQMLKAQTAALREESKIMSIDANSITDPIRRDWIRNEQLRIHAKIANRQQFGGAEPSGHFNQYFDNLGGSGSDLGDY